MIRRRQLVGIIGVVTVGSASVVVITTDENAERDIEDGYGADGYGKNSFGD